MAPGVENLGNSYAHKVFAATAQELKEPEVAKQIGDRSAEPAGSTPEEMDQFLKAERGRYGKVIRATGIKAQQTWRPTAGPVTEVVAYCGDPQSGTTHIACVV